MNCQCFIYVGSSPYLPVFQGAETRAILDRMATTRATAGDVPITSGVDVAISSTDSAPSSAVGTRSRGCAGLVSETYFEITTMSTMLP